MYVRGSSFVLALVAACSAQSFLGCRTHGSGSGHDGDNARKLVPQVQGTARFLNATNPGTPKETPRVARYTFEGDYSVIDIDPCEVDVFAVEIFKAPGTVDIVKAIKDQKKHGEYFVDTLMHPPKCWKLCYQEPWGTDSSYTLLFRYVYTASPRRVAEVVKLVKNVVGIDPNPWVQVGGKPGDQATIQHCNGTFMTTGYAYYDIEVTYPVKPRAIRIYAAPAGTSPWPTTAAPTPPGSEYLVYSPPSTEIGAVDPATGVGSWTLDDIEGSFDTSASTYWMAIEVIYQNPAPPNPAAELYLGSFTNISPVDPIDMEPLP